MNTTTFLGDKPINRMGFGAMQLAGPGVFGPPRDPDAARAVLRRAIELGVDHIDTSQYYGPDVVNDLIREALHPYPENLKLVTKVGARRDDAGGCSPLSGPTNYATGWRRTSAHFEWSVWTSSTCAWSRPATTPRYRSRRSCSALEEMRQEGKLDLIGLSNVDQATVRLGLEFVDVAEIQNGYSIIDRQDDEMVELRPGARDRVRAVLSPWLGVHGRAGATGRGSGASSRSRTSTGPRRPRSLWRGCWLAMSGCC